MKSLFLIVCMLTTFAASAENIQVKVNGMVCSLCAQGIQKKFSAFSQIQDIDVNLEQKTVNLKTDDSKALPDGVITKVITEAGYNVSSIERK